MNLLKNRSQLIKLLLFLFLSIISLLFWLKIAPTECLRLFIRNTGYWWLLFLTIWFSWSFYKLLKKHSYINWEKHKWGLLLCLLGSIFIHIHEPHAYKILEDEYTLGAMAKYMHQYQEQTVPYAAHYIDGRQVLLDDYPNKRPGLYPFTVSLLHNLTGFRPENAYIVNGISAATILLLLYTLGNLIGGRSSGLFAVILILGLPLFIQNATGAGFDLYNALFILILLLSSYFYWKEPGDLETTALVLSGVLLANIRYESILYMLFIAGILLLKRRKSKDIKLNWTFVICPLLLSTALANIAFFWENPIFLESAKAASNFWKTEYIRKNIGGDLYFLFNIDGQLTNSIFLSMSGLIGYIYIAAKILSNNKLLVNTEQIKAPLLLILFSIPIFTSMTLLSFWANWDDPVTSRFSMPLQIALVLSAICVLRRITISNRLSKSVILISILYLLIFSTSNTSKAPSTNSLWFSKEAEWQKLYLKESNYKKESTLIIANFPLRYILWGYPCISKEKLRNDPYILENIFKYKYYDKILVIEDIIILPNKEKNLFNKNEAKIPNVIHTKEITSKQVSFCIYNIISEVTNIEHRVENQTSKFVGNAEEFKIWMQNNLP
ncbi:MAG: glycosyltransferase family 39 protein [Opitutales bacterium]|nr:glycosyltransferase family 39 protein [Opitutales bacterium]